MAVNRHYSNVAVITSLTAGVNNSVTTISVAATTGFPVSYPYTLVLDEGTPSEELVEVTSASGLDLTVTRGVDGTTAASHASAATVKHSVSAQDFREPQEHMDASTGVHGVTGSVVGTTDTQSLTNKDLSDPTNTFGTQQTLPAGAISLWPTNTPPTDWLLADGSAVSRVTYADLFAVLGTTYGAGDGSTTFNLPNLKGRVPVGRDAGQTEFDSLGEAGGAKTHTLSAAEMPSHSHSIDHDHGAVWSGGHSADHSHTGWTDSQGNHQHYQYVSDAGGLGGGGSLVRKGYNGSGGDLTSVSGAHSHNVGTNGASTDHAHLVDVPYLSGTSGGAGSGGAHNNLQPYVVLNYIIKT